MRLGDGIRVDDPRYAIATIEHLVVAQVPEDTPDAEQKCDELLAIWLLDCDLVGYEPSHRRWFDIGSLSIGASIHAYRWPL